MQVPHVIDAALERGKTKPRLDYTPTRFFWFSEPAFHKGIETHQLDGVRVRFVGLLGKARDAMPIDGGFGDIAWLLAKLLAFDGEVLAKAIAATFKNRETAIDVAPIALTPDFTEQASTSAQWTAFRKKLPNTECPGTLAEVVPVLAESLLPIARVCESGESFEGHWTAGGPWTRGTGCGRYFARGDGPGPR